MRRFSLTRFRSEVRTDFNFAFRPWRHDMLNVTRVGSALVRNFSASYTASITGGENLGKNSSTNFSNVSVKISNTSSKIPHNVFATSNNIFTNASIDISSNSSNSSNSYIKTSSSSIIPGNISTKTSNTKKIKIQIASDLHTEYYTSSWKSSYRKFLFNKLIRPSAPILALLGDIGVVGQTSNDAFNIYRDFLLEAADNFEYVIVIAGNHEYYNFSLQSEEDKIIPHREIEERIRNVCASARRGNLIFLQRGTINGSRFGAEGLKIIGAMLWSDIPLRAFHEVGERMADYRRIYKYGTSNMKSKMMRTVTPRETTEWHKQDLEFIENEIRQATLNPTTEGERCLVLTHHAPLARGTAHPKYETLDKFGLRQNMNTAFSSPLDHLFYKEEFAALHRGVWAFGHTHYFVDRIIPPSLFPYGDELKSRLASNVLTGTRLISNPKGYDDENNYIGYRHDFVFEV